MVNTIINFHCSLHEKLINKPPTTVEPARAAGTATIIYNSFCHPFDTDLMNLIINLITGTKIGGIYRKLRNR
jgi:hypothetical protein